MFAVGCRPDYGPNKGADVISTEGESVTLSCSYDTTTLSSGDMLDFTGTDSILIKILIISCGKMLVHGVELGPQLNIAFSRL